MSVMLICVVQDDKLHRACAYYGNLSRVEDLVKQGASVNSKIGWVSV